MRQPWYSIYNINNDYIGTEPPFIDPHQFDWANEIQKNAEEIKKEFERYLQTNNLESYFNSSMVSKPNSWKTIALKTWDVNINKHQKELKLTTELIKRFPNIVSCSFNLLSPKSRILPHKGDTNAIYRCHFGLSIPAGLPDCGFRVKNETREWQNNEWLLFMDAYKHEAWNNTDEKRYILLIDVIRDEFRSKKKSICATVLTSLFLQKRAEKNKWFYKLKQPVVTSVTKCLVPFARMASVMANAFKVF